MLRLKLIGPNQTALVLNNGVEIFFSYETPVVINTGKEILVTDQKFSSTTSKHINAYVSGWKTRKVPQSEIENFLA